jgi:hypothetical protein
MQMEGNILQRVTAVVTHGEMGDIENGQVGLVVGVWVHHGRFVLSNW